MSANIPTDKLMDSMGNEVFYLRPDYHRTFKRPDKTRWTIGVPEEQQVFLFGYGGAWRTGNNTWGLCLIANVASYVGVCLDGTSNSFIAIFVEGSSNHWHGYPVDHLEKQKDLPSESLLLNWVNNGYFSSQKMRKLLRGQPCNL